MDKFLETIDYEFQNVKLLDEALTHPSVSRQNGTHVRYNYERLEFLGDSVLGLVIAELLLAKYPDEKEGALAKRQSGLVRGDAVANVARKLNVGASIKMTRGEESMGGRDNASNIENALEAIIGAMYLDGGLDVTKKFIIKHWKELVDNMKEPPKDFKTSLQEWAQGRGLPIPLYEVVNTTGPSHAPIFTVKVTVQGLAPIESSGISKKKAEKDSAEKMLKIIREKYSE